MRRLTIRRDLDDATLARKRRRHIKIAFDVKSQTLRPSQPAKEIGDVALHIDPVDTIEARSGGASNKQIALRAKRQVISRNAGFERGKHKNLAVGGDFENRSAAVAHVEVARAIKGNAGRHSHALRVGRHRPVGSNPVHGPVVARRNVHLAGFVESDRSGVH